MFDIAELREITSYDELELDTLGDRRTALFLIMSDTDDSFNFLISMCYTQLFNLLCEKADDVYGGRLPVHVRCLIDECANIGQIPKLEKLVATIRSREISACLVLQAQSQLKAIYKDNADTIIGNMDSSIFLGGKEPTTLKELAAVLGKAAQAERKLEKTNIEALFQKSVYENPAAASNPLSRWQQKQQIKKQYAAAKRAAQSGGSAAGAAQKTGKAAKTVKEKAQQAGAYVMRHKKGFGIALGLFLIVCLLLNTMSSCSMMAQSIGSMISGTTYPSDDPELVAVEANYAAKEAALQAEIDNIESSHPGYDEYRYDLDMIGHDPHELAAYLSAVLQGYTRASAQAELERIFAAQYQLTLTEEVEVRYRTETRTDSEGNEYDVEVPYNYYILNVTLTSKPISSVALELLTPDQLEMYQVYRQTLGNKPLIFGGGSADTSDSESLAGVEFVNGTRPGNQAVVDIAKSQVGNVGGQPYWSWYGFNSRVEWCACFVSWCYGQMGLSEPRFAACQSQGIPWFQSHGQWGGRDYANIAPGDAIFFDWDLDGSADHVGIVVGTDGSRVYTVEGNSGDACKIKSYSLTYECIKGYGLMNW